MHIELPAYTDVILPLAVPQYYTYKIPIAFQNKIKIGCRVTVILGKRRIYTALVRHLHDTPPEGYEIREIISLLDENPSVNEKQIEFWEWLADYYMCTPGEVYRAALPSGLILESETRVFLLEFDEDEKSLTRSEYNLVRLIAGSPGISINKLTIAAGKKDLMPVIKRLIEMRVIALGEKLIENYKPRLRYFVGLTDEWQHEEKIQELLNTLEKRAPKQAELLMGFIRLRGFGSEIKTDLIAKDELLRAPHATHAALNALVKKKVICLIARETSRLAEITNVYQKPHVLKDKQADAYHQIKQQFTEKDVVLLHGVTSSGKTEIYIHLIDEYLRQGKQVLYLLPEIALTTQIIQRLKNVFGNKTGVYHSKFSDSERVEVYQNLNGEKKQDSPSYQVILGVRSSVFLPFSNLGLVIIDEEYENTYKQFDPAPRYNARDAAVVLAGIHGGKVLMGTATPSFESYLNTQTGRYGLVELPERYLDIRLPEIKVVDVREARRKKKMKTIFSPLLIDEISEALGNNEQVILFQNRRGFSPYLECNTCGWIPYCKHCDVSLTYHKMTNRLQCHYCGYSIPNLSGCSSCGSSDLHKRGFGTEKVEDEIRLIFPEAKVARMDLDSTGTRRSYEKIINDFENRKVDILIGTQMVSKGLDFDHVRVVGILNADNMLNFPDFRSYERSFQLIAQVSGRAGRRNKRGRVILQTGDPENTVIKHLLVNDYTGFFEQQMEERKTFKYPPYFRLVKLTLRHKKLPLVIKAADMLAAELGKILGDRVVGPEFPLINRVFGLHQKCILVKLERDKLFAGRRKAIKQTIDQILASDEFKGLHILPDVDPYN